MKLLRILPLTLPIVLALPALAHIDPKTKLPPSDVTPANGPLYATWSQDSEGFGRLTGELFDQNSGRRLHLDAIIEPVRYSVTDSNMLTGVVRGQLYQDDLTDAENDLFVVGTFARLPDFGAASCLIVRYQDSGAVEVIGEFTGNLLFPMPLVLPPDSDVVQLPASDFATARPDYRLITSFAGWWHFNS